MKTLTFLLFVVIVTMSCCEKDPIIIDPEGGGTVVYFQSGDPGYVAGETHGIVFADVDQSPGIVWGGYAFPGIDVPGTSTLIGTGQANTTLIVAAIGTQAYEYAAQLCDDLILEGYDDWYLPSLGELDYIFDGYWYGIHWSSSQTPHIDQAYSYPMRADSRKNKLYPVRAIRSF